MGYSFNTDFGHLYNLKKGEASMLKDKDPIVQEIIDKEYERQQNHIELIASENITSKEVMEAMGSVLTNKYAEGYPRKRYYAGCEHVDTAEQLAIDRAKEIFDAQYVNVQPHSGSQANFAVYFALLQPHDTVCGMSLDAGGHLTHGSPVNFSGKWFNNLAYGVTKDGRIDYDYMEEILRTNDVKMLILGGSAYPRNIDYKRVRDFIDANCPETLLFVDMAHFAGLVAGKQVENPLPYADVVTTTTHKTLRGPRGGMILTNRKDIAKKVNKAVFPGIQGGPLEHVILAKAVCFGEILKPGFKQYVEQVMKNAKVMAECLESAENFKTVSGGTDTHLILLDLTDVPNVMGKDAEREMERVGMICNMNSVPGDEKPMNPSGVRLGTPAITTRGFDEDDTREVCSIMIDVIQGYSKFAGGEVTEVDYEAIISKSQNRVTDLCKRHPIYK